MTEYLQKSGYRILIKDVLSVAQVLNSRIDLQDVYLCDRCIYRTKFFEGLWDHVMSNCKYEGKNNPAKYR